ncbi:unnamed protein product [Prunus armeniaca]
MSLPDSLSHDAHEHPLYLNSPPREDRCKGLHCIKCEFHLCVPCAKLPPTTRYKYSDNPIKLAYRAVKNGLGEYYCEICEGERDPTHRFYSSADGDFECNPHCILGRYPQVKLGSSYKHDAHEHLGTLVDKRKSVIPFDKERIFFLANDRCLNVLSVM